uniref:Uncharacterized protein n=1 Tax=viral metagenome TaxID=1070528 RepID=A0A6C0I336_9ZZZZ
MRPGILCLVIILIIIIILLICGCAFWSCGDPYYDPYYYGVDYFKNGGKGNKGGFFNRGQKTLRKLLQRRKGGFDNPLLSINNNQDIPSQLMPNNYQKRALMGRNIGNMQGNATKEMFGRMLPFDGGNDLNLPNKKCTGFGENTKCDDFYDFIKNGNSEQGQSRELSGRIATAEQEMFMADRLSNGETGIDPSLGSGGDYGPKGDYESYVTSLVADERLQENHRKWVHEMLPWSGTARNVDNIDEAMSNSIDFRGLRRPQAIVQGSDALFKTEIDATNLIDNKPFRFNDSRPIEV